MSEVYSKTPPTEPGWYWIRLGECCTVAALWNDETDPGCEFNLWYISGLFKYRLVDTQQHLVMCDDDMLDTGFEFGPRVPSADELTAIQADQIRLAWLFRTVLQAWPREHIDAQMARDKKDAQVSWHPERGREDNEDFVDPECP